MKKPKIKLDELIELVESRCFRVMLSPMFDDPVFLEARLKATILDLFKELHLADRFIRPGYVPAFDITFGIAGKNQFSDVNNQAHIHFKDEDIEFLFSQPTDMQQQFIDLQKKITEATGIPTSLVEPEKNNE